MVPGRSALVLLLGSMVTLARSQPFLVDTAQAVGPGYGQELYTFPMIRMPEHPVVADRINRDLCIDLLAVDPDTANGDLFSGVWGDTTTGRLPRLSSISWSVRHPLPNVLDVEFSAEACGAYCEGFTLHRAYDLRSGGRMEYDQLFTQDGLAHVNDTLAGLWRPLLQEKLKALNDSLQQPSLPPDMHEYFQEAVELYQGCLAERPAHDPYVGDMEVSPEGLRLFIARCSAHWNRNADELDPVFFLLPYTRLDPHFLPATAEVFGR